MQLTRFTDYTLRVLIYLGTHQVEDRLATISDIATAYDISENHLMKVVHHLARAGHVETIRGKGGGIRLARAPEKINIGEVVRGAEEHLNLVECFQRAAHPCPIAPACMLSGLMERALDAFLAVLDRQTLADLLMPREKLVSIFHNAGRAR